MKAGKAKSIDSFHSFVVELELLRIKVTYIHVTTHALDLSHLIA